MDTQRASLLPDAPPMQPSWFGAAENSYFSAYFTKSVDRSHRLVGSKVAIIEHEKGHLVRFGKQSQIIPVLECDSIDPWYRNVLIYKHQTRLHGIVLAEWRLMPQSIPLATPRTLAAAILHLRCQIWWRNRCRTENRTLARTAPGRCLNTNMVRERSR